MDTNENTEMRAPAVDAARAQRPGVPQEQFGPVGNAHWITPDAQPLEARTLKDAQRAEFTATFGTGQKPRGVSGVLRRIAYRIPDYRAKRWALLLFADRVDALEDRALSVARSPVTWTAIAVGLGVFGARRIARRRARRFLR